MKNSAQQVSEVSILDILTERQIHNNAQNAQKLSQKHVHVLIMTDGAQKGIFGTLIDVEP